MWASDHSYFADFLLGWISRCDRGSEEDARWACGTVASPYLTRDQPRSGSEPVNIISIVAAPIVRGAAVATVAVGAVFVALILAETLNRSPDEIAKEARPVD